jgi:hypothetical protein
MEMNDQTGLLLPVRSLRVGMWSLLMLSLPLSF